MADYSPTLPGPDAEPTETPDLQTASGQPTGGQGSLLEALQNAGQGSGGGLAGGGGGIPQDAILSLLQGPSFGQRMGQALAGGAAAVKGIPNPANAIIEQQQRQQLGIAAMLQRMSEQDRLATQWGINQQRLNIAEDRRHQTELFKEARETKQDQQAADVFKLDVNQKLLDATSNPVDKARLAQERAGLLGKFVGAPIPQSTIDGWIAPSPMTQEREKQIAMAFNTANGDPQLIAAAAKMYNLAPDQVALYSNAVKDDAALKVLGIPSKAALKDEQNQFTIREQQAKDSVLPFEQRKDPKWYAAMDAMTAKTYPNLHFSELDATQRARVFDMTKRQEQLDELWKFQQQANITAQKQMQVFGAQQDILQQRKEAVTLAESSHVYTNKAGEIAPSNLTGPEARARGFFQVTPKELAESQQAGMALKQLEVIKDSVKKMEDAGLTAESTGISGFIGDTLSINARRYSSPQARAMIVNLEALKGELVNILRKTGDNARAAKLLEPTIQALSPMSGAKAIRDVMSNLEAALRASGSYSRTPEIYTNIPPIFPRTSTGIPGGEVDANGMAPGRRD